MDVRWRIYPLILTQELVVVNVNGKQLVFHLPPHYINDITHMVLAWQHVHSSTSPVKKGLILGVCPSK